VSPFLAPSCLDSAPSCRLPSPSFWPRSQVSDIRCYGTVYVSQQRASLLVSAAPTHEISRSLILRQSTTDSPQCKALCDPANAIVAVRFHIFTPPLRTDLPPLSQAAPKDACTDANVDKVAACFNCAVAAGEDREIVQEVGDGTYMALYSAILS
jgi:hypothetical protein